MNCLQASVKYESQALAPSINTQSRWYRCKRVAELAIRMHNVLSNWISSYHSIRRCVADATVTSSLGKPRLRPFTDWLVDSKLSGVRGVTGQLSVDLPADIHQGCQSKIHAIGAINELLEFHICYPLANFPDAIGRTLWPNGTKRMIVETGIKIFGNCLIPSTAR